MNDPKSHCSSLPKSIESLTKARRHIENILRVAIGHTLDQRALIVADSGCELATLLGEAYKRAFPKRTSLNLNR